MFLGGPVIPSPQVVFSWKFSKVHFPSPTAALSHPMSNSTKPRLRQRSPSLGSALEVEDVRTVDASEIRKNHLECIKTNPINNGITYQPQLASQISSINSLTPVSVSNVWCLSGLEVKEKRKSDNPPVALKMKTFNGNFSYPIGFMYGI